MNIEPYSIATGPTPGSLGFPPLGSRTASPSRYTGLKFWVGFVYSKMAANLLDLTDPRRPKHVKRSSIQLMLSRIEWIIPHKSFRILRTNEPTAKRIAQPVSKVPARLEPNIDKKLGVKFEPPKNQPRFRPIPAIMTVDEFRASL